MQFAPKLHAADAIKGSSIPLDRFSSTVMGDELPILKGILNGVVNYHNARRCSRRDVFFFFNKRVLSKYHCFPFTTLHPSTRSRDFLTEEGFVAQGQGNRHFRFSRARKSCAFPSRFFFFFYIPSADRVYALGHLSTCLKYNMRNMC